MPKTKRPFAPNLGDAVTVKYAALTPRQRFTSNRDRWGVVEGYQPPLPLGEGSPLATFLVTIPSRDGRGALQLWLLGESLLPRSRIG